VTGFDAAVAPGAPQLHEEVPGNVALEFESGDEQAVAAAFARAKRVSKLKMDSQRLVGNMMEPRACVVAHDAASGRYTFHVPLQGVGGMRAQLSAVSGVPADQIVIATQDVGGSFGVHGSAYPEYFAAMLAAKQLGRPVKWVSSRSEGFMTDTHGRGNIGSGELAIDASGRFVALRFDWITDQGGYIASGGVGYLAAFLLELPVGASQAAVAALRSLVLFAVGLRR
jgi:carbon-monoxide dehydrogenase large subunit